MHPAFSLFSWRLWVAPVLLLALFTPLWLHVWEPGLFLAMNHAMQPLPAEVWTGLSLLGNGWVLLALMAPLLLTPRWLLAALCAAPFATLFARGGKALLESPRPAAVIDPGQFRVVGELLHNVSMPSGHTTTAFAIASALALATPPPQRVRVAWLLGLLACGAGLSRIAVGAHWPGDVAVGACLGLLSGLLGNTLLQALPQRLQREGSPLLHGLALLIAVCIWQLLTEQQDFAENRPLQWLIALWGSGWLLRYWVRTLRA